MEVWSKFACNLFMKDGLSSLLKGWVLRERRRRIEYLVERWNFQFFPERYAEEKCIFLYPFVLRSKLNFNDYYCISRRSRYTSHLITQMYILTLH